jgi:hypothetical protein
VETYEEWRLVFEVGDKWKTLALIEEAADQTPEDVDIHRRGDQLLVYARSEWAIQEAEKLISRLLELRGLTNASTLTRWNPGAERWQDPRLPIEPADHDIGPDWAALGELGWEIRLRSQDAKEARRLAQELSGSGHPTITGLGNRMIVGVADETEASALASELRLRAPTARIETRPLSRWRRWLIRQRVVGNYAGGGDFGGDGGGNGGGGG